MPTHCKLQIGERRPWRKRRLPTIIVERFSFFITACKVFVFLEWKSNRSMRSPSIYNSNSSQSTSCRKIEFSKKIMKEKTKKLFQYSGSHQKSGQKSKAWREREVMLGQAVSTWVLQFCTNWLELYLVCNKKWTSASRSLLFFLFF